MESMQLKETSCTNRWTKYFIENTTDIPHGSHCAESPYPEVGAKKAPWKGILPAMDDSPGSADKQKKWVILTTVLLTVK